MLCEAELVSADGTAGATCTICGLMIACDKTRHDLPAWTDDAVLLVDESLHLCEVPEYHWRQTRLPNVPVDLLHTERHIKRIPAQNIVSDYFRLFQSRGAAVISGVTGFHDVFLQHHLYLPAHRSCSYVVDDFIASEPLAPHPWKDARWTWSKVWDILRLRAEAQSLTVRRVGPRYHYRAVEPNNFFLPWNQRNGHESDPSSLNLGDPTLPGDWIEQLSSHAKLLPQVEETRPSLQARLQELPLEILDHILRFISPLEDLPQPCTRLAPASVWRYALLSRPSLSWLPRANDGTGPHAEVEGDWEALARHLTSKELSSSDRNQQNLPPSFVNRHRLWHILSSMYPGDTRPIDLFPAEWPLPPEWASSARLDDTVYVAKDHPDCIEAHECHQLSIDMGSTEQRKPCSNRECMCGKPSSTPSSPVSAEGYGSEVDWEVEERQRSSIPCQGCHRLDVRRLRQRCRGARKHECSQFWTLTELQQLGGEEVGLGRTNARQCRRSTH